MKVDVSKNKALKQFLCVFVAILSVRLTIFLVSTSDQVIKHVDEQKVSRVKYMQARWIIISLIGVRSSRLL